MSQDRRVVQLLEAPGDMRNLSLSPASKTRTSVVEVAREKACKPGSVPSSRFLNQRGEFRRI
jgi:hypothetical protein